MAIDRVASLAVDIVINARRFNNFMFRTGPQGVRGLETNVNSLRNSILGIGLAASAFLLIRKAVGLLQDVVISTIKSFAQLEDQIANVQKIAKAANIQQTADAFLRLGQDLRGVDFQTISDTMQSAARAGIRLGEGLEEFTRAALILQRVSGDLQSREAAEGLAALILNLNLAEDEAVAVASTIDTLSDNFLATSGEILKTTARLSGLAQTTGTTLEQITGLSTALLSSKQSATVVRTSIVRLFTALVNFEKLEKTSQILGMTEEAFRNLDIAIRTDAVEGVRQFIAALNQAPLDAQNEALRELGLAGARVAPTIKFLQNNFQDVDKAISDATIANRDSTSVLEKYWGMAQTAQSAITDLTKEWELFKASLANLGPLNVVLGALERFNEFRGNLEIDQQELPQTAQGDLDTQALATRLGILEEEKLALQQQREFLEDSFTKFKELFKFSFDPEKGIGKFLKGFSTGGITREINKIEDDINLIKEIFDKRKEAEANMAQDMIDAAAKQKKLREEEARIIEEQNAKAQKATDDFIEGLPVVVGTQLDQSINRLRDGFRDAQREFDGLRFKTAEAAQALENFSEDTQKAIDNLINQEINKTVDELSGTIIPRLGKVGEAFKLFQDTKKFETSLEKLQDFGVIGEQQATDLFQTAKQLMMQELEGIGKQDKPFTPAFSDLRDLSTKSFRERKRDKINQAQLDAAKMLVRILEKDQDTQRKHTQHLQTIAERLTLQ